MLVWALAVQSSSCSHATTTSPGPVTAMEGLRSPASPAVFSTCGALQVPFAARTLPLRVMWLSGGTFSVQTTPAMPPSFMAMTGRYRLPVVVMAVAAAQWTPSTDVLSQMPCDALSGSCCHTTSHLPSLSTATLTDETALSAGASMGPSVPHVPVVALK